MSQDTTGPNGSTTGGVSGSEDPAEIEAHIRRTREDLETTIEALGAKLDVRSRAAEKVEQARQAATDESGRPTPAVIGVAAGLLAAIVAVVWWRRR